MQSSPDHEAGAAGTQEATLAFPRPQSSELGISETIKIILKNRLENSNAL